MATPSDYVGRQVVFCGADGQETTAIPYAAIITEIADEGEELMNVHVFATDFKQKFLEVPYAEEYTIGYWSWPVVEPRP